MWRGFATNGDPQAMAANLTRLEAAAWPDFAAGPPRSGSGLPCRSCAPPARAPLLLAAEALVQDCGRYPATTQNMIQRHVRGQSLATFQRLSPSLPGDSVLANVLTRPTPAPGGNYKE
jgi:hypothetical protein